MLQMVLDGQSKMDKRLNVIEENMKKGFKGVEKRVDKLGMDLAHLSDDAPMMEDFEILEQKVEKLEHKYATL